MLIRYEPPNPPPSFIRPRRTLSGIAYAAPACGLAEQYIAELHRAALTAQTETAYADASTDRK